MANVNSTCGQNGAGPQWRLSHDAYPRGDRTRHIVSIAVIMGLAVACLEVVMGCRTMTCNDAKPALSVAVAFPETAGGRIVLPLPVTIQPEGGEPAAEPPADHEALPVAIAKPLADYLAYWRKLANALLENDLEHATLFGKITEEHFAESGIFLDVALTEALKANASEQIRKQLEIRMLQHQCMMRLTQAVAGQKDMDSTPTAMRQSIRSSRLLHACRQHASQALDPFLPVMDAWERESPQPDPAGIQWSLLFEQATALRPVADSWLCLRTHDDLNSELAARTLDQWREDNRVKPVLFSHLNLEPPETLWLVQVFLPPPELADPAPLFLNFHDVSASCQVWLDGKPCGGKTSENPESFRVPLGTLSPKEPQEHLLCLKITVSNPSPCPLRRPWLSSARPSAAP